MEKLLQRIHRRDDTGFTLVELLVAMLVGLMVLGIAVMALVATNSASLKILSRAEVQANTRRAVSLIFSEVSDAESLPVCRVTDDQISQLALAPPALEGTPGSGFTAAKCIETAASGLVIAFASPNRLCYFKTPSEIAITELASTQPSVRCISRGGAFSSTQGRSSLTSVAGCINGPTGPASISSRSPYEIYTFDCAASGGNLVQWPTAYSAVNSSVRFIADLDDTEGSTTPPGDLFRYINDENNPVLVSSLATREDFKSILGVFVTLNAQYDARDNSGVAREYEFSQKIILRGSEAFREEKFDG